jgi:putrescine aminotransferase
MAEQNSRIDREIYNAYAEFVNPAYPNFLGRLGIHRIASRAEGCIITDSAGTEYLDCSAGYGIYNLGHNHPAIVTSLISRLESFAQHTRPFITSTYPELASALAFVAPKGLSSLLLCNSGSEAIDSAIKLARLNTRREKIITAERSYHGYTIGALSASGLERLKRPFGRLLPGFIQVPFGETSAIESAIDKETAAVLLEPIQHEAGPRCAPDGYLERVQELCARNGSLLIIDEVKTGFGKTGTFFAVEHDGIVPDILALGKSMGGGLVPVGGLLGKRNLWKKLGMSIGMSASSYAGHALACCAAMKTVELLSAEGFLLECRHKAQFMHDGLQKISRLYPSLVNRVSGRGFLAGLRFPSSQISHGVCREMISRHVLVFQAYGDPSTVMIEPPLVISREQIQKMLDALRDSLDSMNERD